MILLHDKKGGRFFLAPDAATLGQGDLQVASLTGESARVDPDIASRYQVPETVARAWADEHAGALKDFTERARAHLDQMHADGEAQLAELMRKAGMSPATLLPSLGVDPDAPAEEQLSQLVALTRALSAELPNDIAAAGDAASRLANLDRAIADAGGQARAVDVIKSLADDPDADDELRKELAELEALARQLDEP